MMILIHMLCSLLSYVAFLIAFLSGWLFLIQERQLKQKRMGLLFHRLPSLGVLDRVNFLAISVGFGLLSLGMLCGLAAMQAMRGRWWIGDPKEILTLVLWLSYCTLWLLRWRATLRGHRVAWLSMLGFSLVLFTLVGTSYLLPSAHPYL